MGLSSLIQPITPMFFHINRERIKFLDANYTKRTPTTATNTCCRTTSATTLRYHLFHLYVKGNAKRTIPNHYPGA